MWWGFDTREKRCPQKTVTYNKLYWVVLGQSFLRGKVPQHGDAQRPKGKRPGSRRGGGQGGSQERGGLRG